LDPDGWREAGAVGPRWRDPRPARWLRSS